ncbi:hypothetical protein BDW_01525 [Bdellovibrio bacteriovorus W]|uniref:Major outer membrane protein n=1 Tax=Bdellovibrio sp. W TaxID=133189 RepID=Q5GPL2_9BACT|nr:hypothetical protein BDW_01525 [Bdellovibrio bacteriovorus W]CAH17838.1 major outer membrane protein precursor [Bdellovibrio sp. W]
MKKLVILAALTMVAPAAMASKARVQSLANSRQIVDIQNAFDRPYQFMQLSSMATFEWGTNSQTAVMAPPQTMNFGDRHAEGGFLNREEDRAYGLYFGRRSDAFSGAITAGFLSGVFTSPVLQEQNPINVFYASKMGDWTWGVTGKYSSGKNDTNDTKSSSSGIALGATNGALEIELVQGFGGKTENATESVESKAMTQVGVGYKFAENMEVYGQYQMVKADGTGNGFDNTVLDLTRYEVGFVNSAVKTDDVNFFYGVAYRSENREVKNGDIKSESATLPVWLGVEANAASWLVFRGSISQSILLNEVKTEVSPAAETKADLDSIAFNAGVGIKLGNGMLDANFATAANGSLNFGNGDVAGGGQEFLSNVAYTYNF